ncbi:MAG TPA: hypothetical protein VJB82_03145 [Candidatus Peribacterales bacterium]|nr:hypothetical protein [Candidatus Peribacterales bacterium]
MMNALSDKNKIRLLCGICLVLGIALVLSLNDFATNSDLKGQLLEEVVTTDMKEEDDDEEEDEAPTSMGEELATLSTNDIISECIGLAFGDVAQCIYDILIHIPIPIGPPPPSIGDIIKPLLPSAEGSSSSAFGGSGFN